MSRMQDHLGHKRRRQGVSAAHPHSSVGASALLLLTSAACIEATNPCDPSAPLSVQGEGTVLQGSVLDLDDNPVPGITVSIAGRAETAVSGADGSFSFSDLPPANDYELQALPPAPLVGGRTHSGALACRGAVDSVAVRVAVPPPSPEVDVVNATGERSFLLGFGSVEDGDMSESLTFFAGFTGAAGVPDPFSVAEACRSRAKSANVSYHVQVRAPFDVWYDAVLAPYPWLEAPTDVDTSVIAGGAPSDPAEAPAKRANTLYVGSVDDLCAAALCSTFSLLDATLDNPRARCTEVVGYSKDGGFVSLTPFGRYEARVFAERTTPGAMRDAAQLPSRVSSAASTRSAAASLVPAVITPVAAASGEGEAMRGASVKMLTVTAGGRFTVFDGETLRVLGDAAGALDAGAIGTLAADLPQGTMGTDGSTTLSMGADMGLAGETLPIAFAPTGRWLRALLYSKDGGMRVDRLWVGGARDDRPTAEADGLNARDAQLSTDAPDQMVERTRALLVLDPPMDALEYDGAAPPPDAYLILRDDALVIWRGDVLQDAPVTRQLSDMTLDLAGDCGLELLPGLAGGSACVDFGRLSDRFGDGAAVDLRAIEVLRGAAGGSVHVLADHGGDRLLVVDSDVLRCDVSLGGDRRGCPASLFGRIVQVPVGAGPTALQRSRILECDGSETLSSRPALLVANEGSGDVSVIEDVGTALVHDVAETQVLALEGSPRRFFEDGGLPTCADPVVWVLDDDGRVTPIDMRGVPHVPTCASGPCSVSTNGRGSHGAIGRRLQGRGRVLIGGNGMLGELGYLRPSHLEGAAATMTGADIITAVGGSVDAAP